MFQLLIIIVVGVALVAGGLWLAANPGSLSVAWLGWQIDTNMVFGLIALVALFFALWIATKVLLMLASMAGLRGLKTRGNILSAARGMGEAYAALRIGRAGVARAEAGRARAAWRDPVKSPGSLMEADALAMAGERAEARRLYQMLLDSPVNEGGALRGLIDLAAADGDDEALREYTERALFKLDSPAWAARAALDLAARTGKGGDDLERPLQVLERSGEASADEIRMMRAGAFLGKARAARDAGRLNDAVGLCRQALDVAPDTPEAVDMLARLLHATSKTRKAEQVVEETWGRAPEARLARTWRDLAGSRDAMGLADRMQKLAALNPDHPESRLAAAEGAVEAKLWGQARSQLQPLLTTRPDVRTCLLMARIEEGETGDSAKVMDWMRRAVAAAGGLGGNETEAPVQADAA